MPASPSRTSATTSLVSAGLVEGSRPPGASVAGAPVDDRADGAGDGGARHAVHTSLPAWPPNARSSSSGRASSAPRSRAAARWRAGRSRWSRPSPPATCARASGDESRLIRCSHGGDLWHTRSARRAWALWHEIDPRLVVPAGMAWLARRDDGWEAASEATLRAEGIPCERVDATELFPSVLTDDVRFTLFEPEAGILRAREAVGCSPRRPAPAGAQLVPRGPVRTAARSSWTTAPPRGRPRRVGLRRVAARALPRSPDLRITQQDVLYFGAGAAWRTPGVPGWVDYEGAAYGLGDLDGRGVKVAPDREGPESTPRPSSASPWPSTSASRARISPGAFPPWPTLRSSATGPASTSSRPTPSSSSPRIRTTTVACGSWAAARATASSTAPRWPSASEAWLTGRRRPSRASRWATGARDRSAHRGRRGGQTLASTRQHPRKAQAAGVGGRQQTGRPRHG